MSCVNREVGWALIPYPTLPPSLISLMVSGDVKHHEIGSGGDLASAKQLVYSATCSFALFGEPVWPSGKR